MHATAISLVVGMLTVVAHLGIVIGSFSDWPTMVTVIKFIDGIWRSVVFPDATESGLLMSRVVVSTLAVQAGVIEIIAGFRMKTLRGFYLAIVSALLVMLPYVSPLCFLGFPLALWIISTLCDAKVRASFKR